MPGLHKRIFCARHTAYPARCQLDIVGDRRHEVPVQVVTLRYWFWFQRARVAADLYVRLMRDATLRTAPDWVFCYVLRKAKAKAVPAAAWLRALPALSAG
jgi:hypothetical protein